MALLLMTPPDITDSASVLVYADWLEERDEVLARGYRWCGIEGKWPVGRERSSYWWWRYSDFCDISVPDYFLT
jgi:hypothetical protein